MTTHKIYKRRFKEGSFLDNFKDFWKNLQAVGQVIKKGASKEQIDELKNHQSDIKSEIGEAKDRIKTLQSKKDTLPGSKDIKKLEAEKDKLPTMRDIDNDDKIVGDDKQKKKDKIKSQKEEIDNEIQKIKDTHSDDYEVIDVAIEKEENNIKKLQEVSKKIQEMIIAAQEKITKDKK